MVDFATLQQHTHTHTQENTASSVLHRREIKDENDENYECCDILINNASVVVFVVCLLLLLIHITTSAHKSPQQNTVSKTLKP